MNPYLPKYKIRWQDMVASFYDNVWPDTKSVYDWLANEHNAASSYTSDFLFFESEKDQTMFLLKWS